MTFAEQALVFDCRGEELVGILAAPAGRPCSAGVLVIVGGPQYRVGSHRQFVLLSRGLAGRGIPCMRFDHRGIGDATGAERRFDGLEDDIRRAIDTFCEHLPGLQRVVLWGLCDGASAACLYAPTDRRVAGLVLLNPWVRTDAGAAKTLLKHYYLERVRDARFWSKLLRGDIAIRRAIAEMLTTVRSTRPQSAVDAAVSQDLPARMAERLQAAALPLLLILSERDYVAQEFRDASRASDAWSRILLRSDVRNLQGADHTFSRTEWRDAVTQATAGWVAALE